MKTLLALFAAVALLAITARPALADDDYHGGARWGRDQSHYRDGDYRGDGYRGRRYRDRDDYQPRIERHEYYYYREVRPVRYYQPTYYYYSSPRYYYRDDDYRHHHDNHGARDLVAIIGGAILVHEILHH